VVECGIVTTFVLITFVAPRRVRVLLLVYFELVAQAHFTPPSFASFLDDFNLGSSSLVNKDVRLSYPVHSINLYTTPSFSVIDRLTRLRHSHIIHFRFRIERYDQLQSNDIYTIVTSS
jgi:hypothetical protein